MRFDISDSFFVVCVEKLDFLLAFKSNIFCYFHAFDGPSFASKRRT